SKVRWQRLCLACIPVSEARYRNRVPVDVPLHQGQSTECRCARNRQDARRARKVTMLEEHQGDDALVYVLFTVFFSGSWKLRPTAPHLAQSPPTAVLAPR